MAVHPIDIYGFPYYPQLSMKPVIVSKFGGTSMGDAQCMRRSAMLAKRQNARVVVVSATSGTTNQLITLAQEAQTQAWVQIKERIDQIRSRHVVIAKELNLAPAINDQLHHLFVELTTLCQGIHLLKDCSTKTMDTVLTFGERLSSILFASALETEWSTQRPVQLIDARDLIKTDEHFGQAKPHLETTKAQCLKLLAKPDVVYVTQGFIGSTNSGQNTTLGRGGSDFSAALIAEAISASTLEIWTDVPGIATTDPRICKDARPIAEITFGEASELATFGAKVLHPSTLWPALRQNIPVFVGSSFHPDEPGTWIKTQTTTNPLVRALALRSKQALITISTPEMLNTHGFLAKVFNVFADQRVSIDTVTTSEICVAVTVDNTTTDNVQLLNALSQLAQVQVDKDLCLISLVGNNVNYSPGLANKIFSTIADINVRLICQGASQRNFCFLVSDAQGEDVIRRLHLAFIETA